MLLTIPGEPCAKGRPRFYNNRAITPSKTVNYETLVKQLWSIEHRGKWLEGCLACDIRAYFTIPASASAKKKQMMLDGRIRPTKKPDFDNLGKIICDSLNGIAYKDDSQIVDGRVTKWYSDRPRVEIEITEVANG